MEIDRREAVQLVAVGMDIDGPAAEKNAYQFSLATAQARNNRKAVRQLQAIGPPPHLEARAFATRARWAEPERFREVLATIRLGLPATT